MGKPVVYFDIGCRDHQKSRAFYEAMFDWTSEPYGAASTWLKTGSDKGIQGFTTTLGHEPHNYVMIYVEVDDIPAHLAQVEALGGKVLVPQTEVPDGGHFAWFADPDGNLVGLWKPAP